MTSLMIRWINIYKSPRAGRCVVCTGHHNTGKDKDEIPKDGHSVFSIATFPETGTASGMYLGLPY